MAQRFDVCNKTVVLTGAASGIGAALAHGLAARGANLALIDRDADGLAQIHDQISPMPVKVSAHVLDLADAVAIATLPAKVLALHSGIDAVINNAGITLAGDFLDLDQSDFDQVMTINFYGVVRMTRAFLPLLVEQREAMIVNISSVFGIVAVPGQSAYCASKFAVRGFSNALRYELHRAQGDVHVLTVHPGGIKTNIAKNAKPHADMSKAEHARSVKAMEHAFITSAPSAAETIIGAMERKWARVIVGPDAKQMVLLERLRPVRAWETIIAGIKKRAKRPIRHWWWAKRTHTNGPYY